MKIVPVTYISHALILHNKVVLIIRGCTAVNEKWHDELWGGKGLEDDMAYFTGEKKGRIPSMNMIW